MSANDNDDSPPAKKMRLTPEEELKDDAEIAGAGEELPSHSSPEETSASKDQDPPINLEFQQNHPQAIHSALDLDSKTSSSEHQIKPEVSSRVKDTLEYSEATPNASITEEKPIASPLRHNSPEKDSVDASMQDNPLDALYGSLEGTSLCSGDASSTVPIEPETKPMKSKVEVPGERAHPNGIGSSRSTNATNLEIKSRNSPRVDETAAKKESHVEDQSIPVRSGSAAPEGDAESTQLKRSEGDVPQNPDLMGGVLQAGVDKADPEFEYNSSPYESSSDVVSIAASSDDSSDDSAEDYELLDPVEQARRLMEGDGGSDNEEAGKGSTNGQVRTLNEKPEEVIEIPNIQVTNEMKIEELGNVERIVDNLILIKANTTGEYQVLEAGSLLCLEDRTVVGVVAETLGRVQEPRYCVTFTNAETITNFRIVKGSLIFYVATHATFVFTKALKSVKGSDASNIHDEEVGDDEAEFSDDEAEAEHKRKKKTQQQERKAARGGSARGRAGLANGAGSRRPSEPSHVPALKYDDADGDEELYTPLTRPSHLAQSGYQGTVETEFPQEGYSKAPGGFRGRGHRGRGMSRGRGDRRGHQNGQHHQIQTIPDLSLPPPPQFRVPPSRHAHGPTGPQQPPGVLQQPPYNPAQNGFQVSHFAQQANTGLQQQFPMNPQYSQYPHPPPQWQTPHQFPAPNHFPQQPPMGNGKGHPQFPPGAYVNPAFFGNQYQYPPG